NSSVRTMRRKASMSGSTSMNSNSNERGFTVPSFSALLLPCVRVTVFSLSSAMGRSLSAAGALDAILAGEGGLEPCGWNVVFGDFLDALEDAEVMARLAIGPEEH